MGTAWAGTLLSRYVRSAWLLGLANYALMSRTMAHIGSEPDDQPLHWGKLGAVLAGGVLAVFASAYILQHQGVARAFVYLAGVVVVGIFAYLITISQRSERAGLIAALVLTVQTMFYFIFYQQMSTSLNLFALRNVDPAFNVFGVHLWDGSPAQFQAFNPIWIFILSPVLAWAYARAGNAGKDLSSPPSLPGFRDWWPPASSSMAPLNTWPTAAAGYLHG